MSKNPLLYTFMIIIICFLQIIEVHANLWRGKFQQDDFIALREQKKDIFVQGARGDIINISGQISNKNSSSLIGSNIQNIIFTALLVWKLVSKAVEVLKTWAESKISQTFVNWRDSLYH
ncbi:hypothetical protein [Bartonella gabonensis]|uniref:hypothetical protein n=1 Tax=Bartonella gabonensis TaxID=2699889 RepID=UPI00158B7079|nr:hypothetical protein [Bartonella gabonensis]